MEKMNEERSNTERRQGMAIASLILGILSIILSITIIFPFIGGILAIVFGILSLKSRKKGFAITGIITGSIGLFLSVVIIVLGILGFVWSSSNTPITSGIIYELESDTYESESDTYDSQSAIYGSKDGMETFYGDGFELTYSGSLWIPATGTLGKSDEAIHALEYILDETMLIPSGVSGMLGYSTATRAERDDLYDAFYELLVNSADVNVYVVGETETFEVLKGDVYYAAYSLYGNNDELLFKSYVIASESDDTVVSFVAQTGFLTKAGTDIPIMPVLESISFTGRASFADFYEQKVWESGDKYTIGNDTIPSLSQVMDDNDILYTYSDENKTIGKMTVTSLLNYFETPALVPVEIIEITYNDVDDVWGAIDAYGRLLSESYAFYVTYPPTEYPNYGADYRFCELIKVSDSDEAGSVYIAAIYSRDERIIKVQFGTIETAITNDGIGPLNLEAIKREGMTS